MTRNNTVWVIDDDRSIRWVLEKALQKADMQVESFSSAEGIMSRLEIESPDVIISDVRMPGMDGFELLQLVNETYPDIPVIIMTAHSDLDSAVSAFNRGAFEYLPKPFDITEAVELVRRAYQFRQQTTVSENEPEKPIHSEILGEAPAMQEVYRAIGRLARSDITVLVNGESGTGKELVARALHNNSLRKDKPFIALNMAAIPRDLLESELFGHEKGAFTGAQARRKGRFEQADTGTLFLDEIGDMPTELQTRLLRVLADGEFYPIGSHEPVKVDVRIVAATHQNLELLVENGSFREDLFHRLNVIRMQIPALRDRVEDIPILMDFFLQQAANELGVSKKVILPETIEELKRFDWPGNVRQLENTARWLMVMASGQSIHIEDLPPELRENTPLKPGSDLDWQDSLAQWARNELKSGSKCLLTDKAIPLVESILIEAALEYTAGRKQEAAVLLGWGRNTLTRKLKDLNLNPEISNRKP